MEYLFISYLYMSAYFFCFLQLQILSITHCFKLGKLVQGIGQCYCKSQQVVVIVELQFYYIKEGMNQKEKDISIFLCTFEANVERANVLIKFPCIYFLQWKTANGKIVSEGKARPTANNNVVDFNQTLELTTQMIFDNSTNRYFKKETMLNLNLISKSRQDQIKLIGRVTIDLAQLANNREFGQMRSYRLSYCSVDAELTFSAVMKSQKMTALSPQDLDKSSFNDYFSFYSCASRQNRSKKEATTECEQQTSIGYRNTTENVIDVPQDTRNGKNYNQTFFMMQSPKNVNFNRTGAQFTSRGNSKEKMFETDKTVNLRSQYAIRPPSASKDILNQAAVAINMPNFGSKAKISEVKFAQNNQNMWDREKNKFRDQIDGNKQKIEDLQKKILDLCLNLEDSKRHIEMTEKINKEKEQIIKTLKNNTIIEEKKQASNLYEKEYMQLQQKYQKAIKQRKEDEKKWNSNEQTLKRQISQYQGNIESLRRETQDLRKIWLQKKQHYEQKMKMLDDKSKQKDQKIKQLQQKLQQTMKYKYQYQLVKELSDQKDLKLKTVDKDFMRLHYQLQELKRNNFAEEIYKLQLANNQANKNYDELMTKFVKNEEEINKYRQAYIKIETAYEIQSKNYQTSREKNIQNQTLIFNLQKQNIQLKNIISNTNKSIEEVSKKYQQNEIELKAIQKQRNQLENAYKHSSQNVELLKNDNSQLKQVNDKLKRQQQLRNADFQQKIKKIQSTIIHNFQQKERQILNEKQQLESSMAILSASKLSLQSSNKQLQVTVSDLRARSQQQISKLQGNVKSLQSALLDKQEIIKMSQNQVEQLKQNNNEMVQSLNNMKITEKQLQQNITILEEESEKILYILEQKEEIQKQLISIREGYTRTLQQIQLEKKHGVQRQIQIQALNEKIKELMKNLDQKDQQIMSKITELNDFGYVVEQYKNQQAQIKDQLQAARLQQSKLRQIVKQINDRYEQHMKLQQRYLEEIKSIRSEKEQIQMIFTNTNNDLKRHNQELEDKCNTLNSQVDKLQSIIGELEKEKNNYQEKINQIQRNGKHQERAREQMESQVQRIKSEYQNQLNVFRERTQNAQNNQNKIHQLDNFVNELTSKSSSLTRKLSQKQQQICHLRQIIQDKERQILTAQEQRQNITNQLALAQQKINQLNELGAQQFEAIQINEEQFKPSGSIMDLQHNLLQANRYEQLQELLLESDRKNQILEQKISQLLRQMDQLKAREPSQFKSTFSNFNQFQRLEMGKIIDEQRLQIDRLQKQMRQRSTKQIHDQQERIKQLQNHIVELQNSFKLQLDRIINQKMPKQFMHSDLTVINEEKDDDDLCRSMNSVIHSPSRVKSSAEQNQVHELKEKIQIAIEEKNFLQDQLQSVEEQKFNLLSTINEKQIQLEQLQRIKMILQMERDDLKSVNQNINRRMKGLQNEVQSLKCQVNFGSALNINEHSVTRSQPIRTQEELKIIENKEIEIENLRTQVQKYKNKQEQLIWNIKDLEMQLQTVTQNLNHLNASNMNSVLNSSPRINTEEQSKQRGDRIIEGEGYNKEKLLQNLKRNEELKDMSHNLIRALKQREKEAEDQQKLIKDIKEKKIIINSSFDLLNSVTLEQYNKKISTLLRQFQAIKLYVLKIDKTQINEQMRKDKEMKQQDMMKSILFFEQTLKEIKLIGEREDSQRGST